jgi:hypothetical protein
VSSPAATATAGSSDNTRRTAARGGLTGVALFRGTSVPSLDPLGGEVQSPVMRIR